MMKKTILLGIFYLMAAPLIFAGGILTNANQSAQYVRMLSRNASVQVDAVYFNPAGLVKMEDGFHFSLNNQSIFQTKTIENRFPLLNTSTYKGDVSVPVFPTGFAVYKKDKLALSFGFGPNSGGGTAEFKTGLPCFEVPLSQIPLSLAEAGIDVDAYSADLFFNGESIFWGGQFNMSWAFSDVISGAVGVRVILAGNDYEGHIKRVSVIKDGKSVLVSELMTGLAAQASAGATAFAQYPSGAVMPDAVAAQYGFPSGTTFGTAAATMSAKAATATASAESAADRYVDLKQKGTGFTPIIGLNIHPDDKLNIGLKYEFKTKLEMTNHTDMDDLGVYPDGAKFRNDLPAIFTAGVDYMLLDNFKISGSFNHYFDQDANWSGKENEVEKNYYELALGMEYQLTEKTAISAGVMHSETGVGRGYQTDLSYSLSSNTVGFGMQFHINDHFDLDLGGLFTVYKPSDKEITYGDLGTYKEIYSKTNLDFSIGLTYHIFK
ncbi:MAG: OmpP1/FadL family transporter [Mangrovibacterium sp.]